MSDYGEISSLISRIAFMVDHQEHEEDYAKYYVDDVTMVTTLVDGTRMEFKSALEVVNLINTAYLPPRRSCTHIVANPIIDIDGDEARVRYYTILTLWGPGPQPIGLNEYDTRVRRCADGKWRFVSLDIVQKLDWMQVAGSETPPSD